MRIPPHFLHLFVGAFFALACLWCLLPCAGWGWPLGVYFVDGALHDGRNTQLSEGAAGYVRAHGTWGGHLPAVVWFALWSCWAAGGFLAATSLSLFAYLLSRKPDA